MFRVSWPLLLTYAVLAIAGFFGGWQIGRVPSSAGTVVSSRSAHDRTASNSSASAHVFPSVARTLPDAFNFVRPRFADVANRHGIEFLYERGETGSLWLPETMGGGVAWLDFDGDGLLDLYFVQGCKLPADGSGKYVAQLYRNAGTGQWHRVPTELSASNSAYGMGAAAGDINNDGFDDLYVTNFGPDALFQNNGDGTFTLATEPAGLGCAAWGTSSALGDLDRDGDLDLFVANYVRHDPAIVCNDPVTGARKYCGPDYYDGEPSVLYENLGDGRFRDVTESAGTWRSDGKGLGAVIANLDHDQYPEIFVANDLRPNFLFRNRSAAPGSDDSNGAAQLAFEEVGMETGAALNAEGIREANMGIACGDFNNDATLDLYVTHYYMEHDTLWQNLGNGYFSDVTKGVGLSIPTLKQLSWGTNFVDYDNDGWLDLFVTSGHINDEKSGAVEYAMAPQLFYNTGGGGSRAKFVDVSAQAGAYFLERFVGRSSAAGDFNRDGAIDIAVGHHHRPAALIENRTQPRGHAIGLRFVGRASGRSGIGVRVATTIERTAGDRVMLVRELVGGGSYLSADAREILIGLGNRNEVSLDVQWPSGLTQTLHSMKAGGWWTVIEGEEPVDFRRFSERTGDQANAEAD